MMTQAGATKRARWLARVLVVVAPLALLAGCGGGGSGQPGNGASGAGDSGAGASGSGIPASGAAAPDATDPGTTGTSEAGSTDRAQSAPQGPAKHILAFGDSLFAGYGLRPEQAYPVRLAAELRARGLNVAVTNASVSGDTTADGLARIDFTLNSQGGASQSPPPDLVLICLGGNDMLRGLPPAASRANLDAILTALDKRHVRAMLMGMLAAPNLGRPYAQAFDAIYPALARKHHAALYPFFLSAVIDRPDLRQPDHIHPTVPGVEALVRATGGEVAVALRGASDWRR